ncbi:MAG TPA: hypothetical protein VII41_06435, partial [Steroidobacteraceae bacterium]
MPIVINQNVSHIPAPVAAPTPVLLQPGSVVSARVLQIVGSNTVQIAIGGQLLQVQSEVPLQAGQTLQLAVSQTTDGIRLAIVNQQAAGSPSQASPVSANAVVASDTVTLAPDAVASIASQTTSAVAAPAIQLTPQEVVAVATAAQSAATQQSSLANLFADLGVAAGLDTLPQPVQQAIAQLLTQQLSLDQNLTGPDIQQAFQNSGLFLEASLASGSVPSTSTPDLKAALIVLRQVLTTSLGSGTPAQDALAILTATTTQSGAATPDLLQQAATAAAAITLQATAAASTPAALALQAATAAAAAVSEGATPVAIVLGPDGQPVVQVTPQPVTITVAADTPVTASPALVPQLASATAAPQVTVPGVTVPVPTAAPNLSAATDASALAAATSAALTLLQESGQAGTGANLSRLVFDNGAMLSLIAAGVPHIDDAELARANVPPPPIRGAVPTAQAIVPATLVSNMPLETALHHLAANLDGAIARQTLLQVASLPDRVDAAGARADTSGPRWNFEIPFLTPQGTTIAQFEI